VRGKETGLFEVLLRRGHRQDARATFGSGIEVGGGVGVWLLRGNAGRFLHFGGAGGRVGRY
jgi:hypothetical protein